ncbi:MAG: hypothetical protein ACLU7D_04540 [Collinsella sp.]
MKVEVYRQASQPHGDHQRAATVGFSGKCVTVIMRRAEPSRRCHYAAAIAAIRSIMRLITIVDSSEIVGKGFRGTN